MFFVPQQTIPVDHLERRKMQLLRSSSSSTSSSSCMTRTSFCPMKPIYVFVMFIYVGFVSDNKSEVEAANVMLHKEIPAVFFFGDSIVDTGNNNNLSSVVNKCNFPPYGKDFVGGYPTGRYCNGKSPPDFISEQLGLKELVPAFLDPTLTVEDLVTGVSFASGGSGYDPLTATIDSAIPMSEQILMFKRYIERVRAAVGPENTSVVLSRSIFIVSASSNDIAQTYFFVRQHRVDVPSYAQLLVNLASSFVQELYGLGVRRIGLFSAPPLGCVPSQRTLGGGISRECAESRNQACLAFNDKLSTEVSALNARLPGSKIVFLDVYTPLLEIIQNPAAFGFEEARKGCCGTGNIEVTVLCNRITPTCPDATKYVFWDSFHPTEAAYKLLVQKVLTSKTLHDFL